MRLAKLITEHRLRGMFVGIVALQDRSHAHGQERAAVPQPTIACLLVRGENLLDHAIGVIGDVLHDLHRHAALGDHHDLPALEF